MTKRIKSRRGGGWRAVRYSFVMARKAGPRRFVSSLRKSNVCKACALGMKGMRNEIGEGFQVCKKAMQAVAQDLAAPIGEEFWRSHSINHLLAYSGRELESLGRLANPLLRRAGDEHFTPISWDEANSLVIEQLRQFQPDRSFIYASGRSSNEASFLLQVLGRQLGTNHINNCSYYCHQASGVGLGMTFGSGTATVTLEDVTRADLVVLIGCNPSSNHPRFMTHLANIKKKGGKVLAVNPLEELGLRRFGIPSKPMSLLFTSEIADQFYQPHCGGDLAFLKAVAKTLVERCSWDEQFLRSCSNNVDEFLEDLRSSNIDALVEYSGISMEELEQFCDYLEDAGNVVFAWAMGVTHQKAGVDTVRMIANIALLLGKVGRPGNGLLPLRGHSNVQGVGTVGVVPKLKPVVVDRISKELGISIPESRGYDTYACMEAAAAGNIDFAILLGGNLYGSNPDTNWASTSLGKIGFTVQISTTLNRGHLLGQGRTSLILPVRTRDEERQVTTQESMFNFVRFSEGGTKPKIPDLPSEVDLITSWAEAALGTTPVDWKSLRNHDAIRGLIAKSIPGLEGIGKVKEEEFTIPGRIYHQPRFSTDDGQANLSISSPPDARAPEGMFNLTTIRSEGQFNTIVYEDEDVYRGTTHRDVVLVSGDDLEALGVADGDMVVVESPSGSLVIEAVKFNIRSGNVAMYFPEGNVLVPRVQDPLSRTPVFKRVPVTIRPA